MEHLTKLYESDLHGENESASKIYLFRINDTETYEELKEMTHEELCGLFNVFDESGYEVMPGALYHTYDFSIIPYEAIVMVETIAYNV